jgi:hypothetical protein
MSSRMMLAATAVAIQKHQPHDINVTDQLASRPWFCLGNESILNNWMIVMSKNELLSPPARDSTEWNNAWVTVSRLAAARQIALHGMRPDHPATSMLHPMTDSLIDAGSAKSAWAQTSPIDHGQIERAIAEIEQASAVLKSAEPALEAWRPDAAPTSEPRKHRSVWILIGTIWLSMLVVVAGVIGAIAYFLD